VESRLTHRTAGGTHGSPVGDAAPGVNVTGTIFPETINAIRVTQEVFKAKHPAQVVDGRASPARGGVSCGGAVWIIAHLNVSLKQRSLSTWPRIDKLPGCPAELQQMVTRTLVGV
jgi:hypothetical protein